jgi:hypothetical protein
MRMLHAGETIRVANAEITAPVPAGYRYNNSIDIEASLSRNRHGDGHPPVGIEPVLDVHRRKKWQRRIKTWSSPRSGK